MILLIKHVLHLTQLKNTKIYNMLGDDIEKITKATGIKKVVDKLPGDCGCGKRKEKLNNPNLLINKILYKNK